MKQEGHVNGESRRDAVRKGNAGGCPYRVFSQHGPPRIDEILGRCSQFCDRAPELRIGDRAPTLGGSLLVARDATAEDFEAAARAEASGNASGMATLARRCSTVWELHTEDDSTSAFWQLAATLASVALGPVLPPDERTLYGIRSSLAEAKRRR